MIQLMIQLWSHPCCSSGTSDTEEAVLTWTVDNKDSGRVNMEAMFMLVFRFPRDLTRVTALQLMLKGSEKDRHTFNIYLRLFTVLIPCRFYIMSVFMLKELWELFAPIR